MTVGIINTCYVDFLKSRLSGSAVAELLGGAGLPGEAAFVSTCPYADSVLERYADEEASFCDVGSPRC